MCMYIIMCAGASLFFSNISSAIKLRAIRNYFNLPVKTNT
jgi:hypothetical protein